jgi:hypothetical protein
LNAANRHGQQTSLPVASVLEKLGIIFLIGPEGERGVAVHTWAKVFAFEQRGANKQD